VEDARRGTADRFPPLNIGATGGISQFVLGVQYYGPPHTKEDDWRRDFSLIKEHGLDALRVWAFWGYLEPRPREYDLEEWDRLFDLAHEFGLSLVPNLVMEVQPFWIHRVFPKAYMHDQYGRPILSTTGEYSCGLGPGVCLDHPGPRAMAEAFLIQFANHFQDRENLLCWDAWCETRWTDNVNDRVHNKAFVRIPCYCDRTGDGYRRWRGGKYGSLDGVNQSWRRKYTHWSDGFPPRGGWWSYAYPEMVDWREYMIDNVVDKLRLRADSLRKGDPNHLVVMHAGGASVSSAGTIAQRGSDDWENAKVVDLYGTSLFPAWGRIGYANCLRLDGIRSASDPKQYWIGELQGGPSFHSPAKGNNYYPEDVKLWTFATMAYGAKGILYWSWRPEPFGPETFGFGLTLFDGTPTDRTRMARRVARVIKRNESLFLQARPCPSEIAILFDPDLYILDWYGGTGGMVRDMVPRSLHGYYRAFWNNNIQCDFVHAGDLDDLSPYKLLVLPFAFCLREQVAARLESYVRAGGVVLTEAYFGRFQECCVPATTFPTYDLHQVFQVKGTEAEFVNTVDISPSAGTDLFEDMDVLTGHYFKDLLQPLPGSETLATYGDGKPALVSNRYGKGQTYLFGSLMALEHGRSQDAAFDRLIGNVSRAAGVSQMVTCTFSEGGTVKTRVFTCGDDYMVYCINFGEACEATVQIRLGPPAAIHEIISDADVDYEVGENGTQVTLSMDAKDVRVFLYALKK